VPIYEYVCRACGHRADILHGVNEGGPHFCPECGAEGSMRKAFAPPTLVFKGSGWAKKDRSASARSSARKEPEGATAGGDADGASASKTDGAKAETPKQATGEGDKGSGTSGTQRTGDAAGGAKGAVAAD
jgi:putative FmdB family regulatory protein